MKITELRVNHIIEPMGIQLYPLSFSWKTIAEQGLQKQTWARLTIWKQEKCVHDSGEDVSANSLDYQIDLALSPRTRYIWQVTAAAGQGRTASAKSWFETGKMTEAWQGKWITNDNPKLSSCIFSKQFRVKKKMKKARMYLCGLGVYELYINDGKVGEEYLAPGYHSYDLHLQTQAYDVTAYLREGSNEIAVWLGEGWFKGRLGFDGGYYNLYGDRLSVIAELHIEYEDAQAEVITTGRDWECRRSPIVFSGIYDGEIYDANVDQSEAAAAVVEQAPKGCGALGDRYSLPIVKKESFEPIETIHTPKGETVLDFGQNLTGWVEFDCRLPKGQQVILTAAEILQDGCFYHENLRTAKTEFVFRTNGEDMHVRPHFTFFGFRYMKVECLELSEITNIKAWHIRSDFDPIGSIVTGNAKVNQLFANVMWSQKDNFLDVPTDCPQRDERLGWTGDAQVFSETACYNMYVPAFFRKYLWDMRAEQNLLDGAVPNVVPRLKQGMVSEYGSCPWADAGVIIPWQVYLHFGSRTMLAETYPGMCGWVDYQYRKETAEGGEHLIKSGFHFADWLALDHPGPEPIGKTDPLFIASAYYYYCTKIVAEASAVLKRKPEMARYQALAEQILRAIQKKYFPAGECICRTQTASALTICFGLMPEKRKEEGGRLQKRIADHDDHLDTGFVGTTLLCPALSLTGYHQTAVDLLLNEEYPGWLYCVNLGATTIWERWNSVLPDGHVSPEGMNSLNHYSYGSIAAWLYKAVIGIAPLSPGYKRAQITPQPDKRLGFAECTLDSAAGRYYVKWQYGDGETITYEIEIPFDAKGTVILPKGTYRLKEQIIYGGQEIMLPAGSYQLQTVVNCDTVKG